MKKTKKLISIMLAVLMLLSMVPLSHIASAATTDYYTDALGKRTGIKLIRADDGRIYYAVGDGSNIIDAVGNDYEFFEKVLTAEYEGVSPVKQWANIASALYKYMGDGVGFQSGFSDKNSSDTVFDELYASNDSDGDFIVSDVLADTDPSTEGNASSNYMTSTGLTYYSSLSALQDGMATEINKLAPHLTDGDNSSIIKNATGKDAGFDNLNNSDNRTVLGTIATGRVYNSLSGSYGVSSFGLAFYDFQVIPLVEDGVEYITAAEGYDSIKAAAGNGAPNVEYKTMSDGMGYTNYTSNPSHSDSTVSVSFSETSTQSVSNSMESTKSFTFGMGMERSMSVSAGIPNLADVEVGVSFDFSLSRTIATAYGTENTLTNSKSTSSTADVTLPAHTKIGITQQPSDIEMTFDYDCPVYITYKVAVFGMHGMQKDSLLVVNSLGGNCTVFGSEVVADGATATENLYMRAVTKKNVVGFEKTQMFYAHSSLGADIPEFIDWSTVSAVSPANGIGAVSDSVDWLKNITPISAAGATMKLSAKGMETSITAIEPLYDLHNVRLDGTGTYDLAIGGSLDLGTVITQGYNQYNIPYYGYSTLNGEWNLCDANGNILDSVDGVSLENISDYQILTAEELGNYYLKYAIYDDIYKNNEGKYLTNADLASTPVIEISVTKTGGNHTCIPGEWKTTIPATCFIEGEQVQNCSVCGIQMNVRKLEKAEHTHMVVTTAPSCISNGSVVTSCGVCGAAISSEEIAATGHNDGIWRIDFEATADHGGQMSRYCSKCNEVLETKEFALHEHKFGYEEVIRTATCDVDGAKGNFCSACGVCYETEAIPAAGHDDGVWKVDFEATADHGGQMSRYCSKCNEVLETKEFEKHEHTEGYTKTTPATCTAEGEKSTGCEVCGVVYKTEVIPANGHGETFAVTTIKATCTENGEKTLFCSDCHEAVGTEEIKAGGHSGDTYVVTVNPTCTQTGEEVLYCDGCGEIIGKKEIPANGHSTEWLTAEEATCAKYGKEENTCTECRSVLETRRIEKEEHIPGKWEITLPSTCTQSGLMQQSCALCGALIGEPVVIEPHEHQAGSWVTVLEPDCENDGEKVQSCTICKGAIATETIPALGHTDGTWITAVEADCETKGEEHLVCTRCEHIIDKKDIEVLGHSFSEWHSNNNGTHSRTCLNCAIVETNNCDYAENVTSGTCTEGGYTTYVCTVCDHTYISDYSEALGHDWSKWAECADGCCHERECEREGCDATETEDHNWGEWVYNEDGKCFENGTKTRVCDSCGASETEEALHTSFFGKIFYPIVVFFGNIVHKIIWIFSLNWLFPELTIKPQI